MITCVCALSDQWDVQDTIKRLVASLQKRGYVVWFGESADGADLEHTEATASIVDA